MGKFTLLFMLTVTLLSLSVVHSMDEALLAEIEEDSTRAAMAASKDPEPLTNPLFATEPADVCLVVERMMSLAVGDFLFGDDEEGEKDESAATTAVSPHFKKAQRAIYKDFFAKLMTQLVLIFYVVAPVDIACPKHCFPMLIWDDYFRDRLLKSDVFSVVIADNWAIANSINLAGKWDIDLDFDVNLCYCIKAAYETLVVLYWYIESKLKIEAKSWLSSESWLSSDNYTLFMTLGAEYSKIPSRALFTNYPKERYFFDLPDSFCECSDRLTVFAKILDMNSLFLKTIFDSHSKDLALYWQKESASMRVDRVCKIMGSRGLLQDEVVLSMRSILDYASLDFETLFNNLKGLFPVVA